MRFFDKIYLDREKDIVINVFEGQEDELNYILETPNHKTGNLITNLAKLCNLPISYNEKGMKIIQGTIPAYIDGENKEVYILRLGGRKVANIYPDGTIDVKAIIPAITKTLMSQTKEYKLPIEKTIVKAYIPKKVKFRTDLHTHIHANLTSDDLIALGIKQQIKYPLYYIKKLGLKLSDKQAKEIFIKRCEIEKKYAFCELQGKKLIRKIDDETYINFADLLLNNVDDMEENIAKIHNSLVLIKDGQAVFTNLEKLYLYRYVFSKGIPCQDKIEITEEMVEKVPEKDVKQSLRKMMQDSKSEAYKNNTLFQDKLLWVAREYEKQGIYYSQIAVRDIIKKGEISANIIKEMHEILPKIEAETNVKLRFLAAISRTLDTKQRLKESVSVIKAVAKSPYIVGCDFIGEEINDIRIFEQTIKELVEYAIEEDNGFTIRIHAGENDSFRENVKRAVECVKRAVPKGKKMPRCRLGHGLYGIDLKTEEGKQLVQELKENEIVLEFQLTSNIRLNNINEIANHPIKEYLKEGIACIQGTDGCGFYGTECLEEQLALSTLLEIREEDLVKMRKKEEEIIQQDILYFDKKSKKFEEWIQGKDIKQEILKLEDQYLQAEQGREFEMMWDSNLEAEEALKEKIKKLPEDKTPVIIAGGSFNALGRETVISEQGKELLRKLVKNLDSQKAYFVVGHKMQGYEKAIVDIAKEMNKKFEIDAIVPKKVTENIKENLLHNEIDGVCVSIEPEEVSIYKSFNYEIFERKESVVVAFDGNSPVSNLVQEAKNGKGKAKIYVNEEVDTLKEKAKTLDGYVIPFNMQDNIIEKIIQDNPQIGIHRELS